MEPGCRELARLYSVARHYSDAAGGQLSTEDFCANAVTSAGPMQEVDACVAGAEEVLASAEVGEAAEKACRRAHPNAAEAPAACRMFVASLSEAIHRGPQGQLVDAEAICGQLVSKAGSQRQVASDTGAAASTGGEERKFVTSCVQFAGSLMSNPSVGEAEVQKSCEAHLPSEEKTFCSGYARLVYQRADATDFANFCGAEYRRMSITSSPPVAAQVQEHVKRASTMAMNMPALCARLFDQAVSTSISGPELKKAASELCVQELNSLAPTLRPPAPRIRVGCNFFANRLSMMKQQQGAATNATAFCAAIAAPPRATKTSVVAAKPAAKVVVAAAAPQAMKVASRSTPVQRHRPALLAPQPPQPAAAAAVAPPTPLANKPAQPVAVVPPVAVAPQLPVLAASAALPALAAATAPVATASPGPAEIAKSKKDEDFLNNFLNKYEADNAAAEASVVALPSPQPQMKVFREDEMAEVRRKAEQLFGSDVDPASSGGAPLAIAPSPPSSPQLQTPAQAPASHQQAVAATPPAVAVAAPPAPVVAQPAATATQTSPPAAAGSSKKTTSMLAVNAGADSSQASASDFLSSFLNAYAGGSNDGSKAPQPAPSQPQVQPQPQAPKIESPPAADLLGSASKLPVAAAPLALLAEAPPPPSAPTTGISDVDSLVSAFLARS